MEKTMMAVIGRAALLLLAVAIDSQRGATAAKFTLINRCSETVWPAILGSPQLETTGFALPKDQSRAVHAPTGWSGRFWARTGCSFDESGKGSCATGDCGSGEMECKGRGAISATLAEFTVGTAASMDFYDVSLVDGYNLPVTVEASGGSGHCASTGCAVDLNQKCPVELKTEDGGACRSACDAFDTAEYCCKGEYGSPATCKPSAYSQMFKTACPKCYSYAYDDATSTFTCSAADYIITFCPSSLPGQKSSTPDGTSTEPNQPQPGHEPPPGTTPGSLQPAVLGDDSWLAELAAGVGALRPGALLGALIPVLHLAGWVHVH